jgi:hypothetical protein
MNHRAVTDALVCEVHARRRPTEGELAELIWRMCSTIMDEETGRKLYARCGYEPFRGYPLTRA